MALVISRTAGTSFYLGSDLDSERPEDTFDARVRVAEVGPADSWWDDPEVEIEIAERRGSLTVSRTSTLSAHAHTELVHSKPGEPAIGVITLHGIREESIPGRSKKALNARLSIEAPDHIRILRDNARKRTRSGAEA